MAVQRSGTTFSKNFTRMFKEMLPDLIRELSYEHTEILPRVNAHVAKCLQYNLVHGKMTRGLAVPISYRLLAQDQSEAAMRKACVLGWCVELMQVSGARSTKRGILFNVQLEFYTRSHCLFL